jgi:TPR repeat protein
VTCNDASELLLTNAIEICQQQASAGDLTAHYNLGVLFNQNSDAITAARHYSVGALGEHAPSQLALANAYAAGRWLELNREDAKYWYIVAGQREWVAGGYALLRVGQIFLEEDQPLQAYKWFLLAENRGNSYPKLTDFEKELSEEQKETAKREASELQRVFAEIWR